MALARIFLTVLFVLTSTNRLHPEATPTNNEDPDVCYSPACTEAAQYILDSMDATADPCHDFYRYACGGWIDKHPIPEEKRSYSVTSVMTSQVSDRVKEILKISTEQNLPKPVLDAAILFQGCVDEEARETQGLDPLKNVLSSFGGWPMADPQWSDAGYQWHTQVANIIRILGISAIISVGVPIDAKNNSRYIIGVGQSSFGLGRNQLIHLTSSERNKEIVAAYRSYIISTGKLFNPSADETQMGNDADEIIQFESELARLSRSQLEKRKPKSLYNKMTVSAVQNITENQYFDWEDMLNIVFQDFPEVTADTEVILYEIDYVKNAIKLAHDTDTRIVANYIGWKTVDQLGSYTTKDFKENVFRFNRVVSGTEKPEKLENVCTALTIGTLGYAVGRLYVDKYFTEEEKREVDEIAEDIRSAYESTLSHIKWMDPVTKDKALDKLRAMANMIGYPPWIKSDVELSDYYHLVPNLNKGEFFSSLMKVRAARRARTLSKWNQPTRRDIEWSSPPPVVNAFYRPSTNSMTFPAGILNVPFYKYGRSLALNYGAIGFVIGHEISHGFDDRGSEYDKDGNLLNWWSKETKEEFDEKANCFKAQYSSYVDSTTNMTLNGNNTVGDDVADNGAIRNAFIAYKLRAIQLEGEDLMKNKRLPGLSATPDQLFFLGYANTLCRHYRKEYVEWSIQYSGHSLHEFRVTVPLSNSKAFAETYNCHLGTRMNPESKCVLW